MFNSDVKRCVDNIVRVASDNGIILKSGIELFCGDGSLYTKELFNHLSEMTGIDISCEKGKKIQKECGSSFEFIQADTLQYIKTPHSDRYDLISIDNPLCIYGNNYCEHFEVLPQIRNLIKKKGKSILVFDYVTEPYNADNPLNREWLARRQQFYDSLDYNIDTQFAEDFYIRFLENCGISVLNVESVCRETYNKRPYFYMLICVVSME